MRSATWCQLKLILERALEQAQGARRDYVALACANNTQLCTEANELLDQINEESDAFLESPATLPSNLRAPEVEWIGKTIAAFRVIRKIGSGGMGDVFLAVRQRGRPRGQAVAVKVIRGGVDSPTVRLRFFREGQIHARLDHPLIPRVLDMGMADDRPYMLLEHVEGQPIDRHCNDNKLGVRERIALFIELCAAVQYLHKQAIVHRDIKPANILVASDGRPRLLDFGIAEYLSPREAMPGSTFAPLEGVAMFTPECAAPEQLRNEAPTPAIDVHGLGVLLYRLLTSRMPHEECRGTSGLDRLRVIRDVDPMRASELVAQLGVRGGAGLPGKKALGQVLRGGLDRILARALARQPMDRYRNVAAFANALARHLDAMPAGLSAPARAPTPCAGRLAVSSVRRRTPDSYRGVPESGAASHGA